MVKKFSRWIALVTLLSVGVGPVMAQDGDGEDETPQQLMSLADTLAAISEAENEFLLFVEALEATSYDVTLDTGGPFTVFAPTDEAITNYLRAQGIAPPEFLENRALLGQILAYHVAPGRFLSQDLVDFDGSALATALPGTAVDVTLLRDSAYINESRVIGTDRLATNGVIFTVDHILLPPDSRIVLTSANEDEREAADEDAENGGDAPQPLFTLNLLTEKPELEAFVTAIQSSPPMSGLVNGSGPYTIFAPTDEGFGAALEILGISGNDLVADSERLNTTLFYHVIPIRLTAKNLADLDGVFIGTTAAGIAVKVNVVDGATYVNRGRISEGLTASNGNIFVVDFLLLEGDRGLTEPAIEALGEAEEVDATEDASDTTESDETDADDASEEEGDNAESEGDSEAEE